MLVLLLSAVVFAGCSVPDGGSKQDTALKARIEAVDKVAFMRTHPGMWISTSTDPGFESVTLSNYDPMSVPPPARQEVVEFGRVGSAPSTRALTVYAISVMKDGKYYVADYDATSKALLFTEGAWALDENQQDYATRQLSLMDSVLGR